MQRNRRKRRPKWWGWHPRCHPHFCLRMPIMNMNHTTPLDAAARELDYKSIDQIIQHLPFNCRYNTRTGYHFISNLPNGTTHVLHARCNQLLCQNCAHRIIGTMLETLTAAARRYRLAFLITLTIPSNHSIQNQAETFPIALARFLHEARRTFPKPLIYWWCYGIGNSESLHVHMIANQDLRRSTHYHHRIAWLKATWHHLTGAQQVKLKAITEGSEYLVVRYLLVNMMSVVLKRVPVPRRYGGSRCIKVRGPKTEPDPDRPTYQYKRGPSATVARYSGVDLNPITNPDFHIDASASMATVDTQPLGRSAATDPAGLRGLPVPPLPAFTFKQGERDET